MTKFGEYPALDEYAAAVEELYDQGETDAMDGGVPPSAVASELGVARSTAKKKLLQLARDDRLRRVSGIQPGSLQHRYSYEPINREDSPNNYE